MTSLPYVLPFPLFRGGASCHGRTKRALQTELLELGIVPINPYSVHVFKVYQAVRLYLVDWFWNIRLIFRHQARARAVLLSCAVSLDRLICLFDGARRPHWYRQSWEKYVGRYDELRFAALRGRPIDVSPPMYVREMVSEIRKALPDVDIDVEAFDTDPLLVVRSGTEEYTVAVW